MQKELHLKTVKPESIVSVKVSGTFLGLLNNVYMNYLSSLPNEEVVQAFIEVQQKKDDIANMSQLGRDIFTMTSLINAITDEFNRAGMLSNESISYDADTDSIEDTVDGIYSALNNSNEQ